MAMSRPTPDATTPESSETSTLFAYKSRSHQAIVCLTVLLPMVFIGILVLTTADLSEAVATTGIQRVTLIVHGLYFAMLPFGFELGMKDLPPFTWNLFKLPPFGRLPKRADNLYWMMTCLSGELFFIGALCYFLIASQASVPRWTLLLPLAQCAYNIKNDILWVGLGSKFSPIGERNTIMALDWLFIGACFIIYLLHYFA
jgi:hypothetical protein